MCTVMYQPYAMSYSSSCDRTTADNLKKSFKFPHAPSPPESSHSNASSAYSSPGSTGGGASGLLGTLSLLPPHLHSPSASSLSSLSNNGASSISGQRRPLTPSCASGGGGSSAPATITSATSQQQQQQASHHHHSSSSSHSHGGGSHHPHHSSSHHHHPHHSSSSGSSSATTQHHHQLHHHHHHRNSSATASSSSLYPLAHTSSLNLSSSSGGVSSQPSATATSSRDLSQHGPSSSSSSSSGSASSHHQAGQSSTVPSATITSGGGDQSDDESPGGRAASSEAVGGGGNGGGGEDTEGSTNRAQYLSANCILYVNYDGNTARVVEEHFNRALSAPYSGEKSSKALPMSTRNFPASFWNSNYQPSKASAAAALGPYGAADFYGTAMDYSASISGFAHHHPQADPWHYPLGTHHHHHHQSYHRPSDITYPSMTSTSRFNAAAQYGSFLFPSSTAAAARFSGIPTPGQCSVKGVTADAAAHHWAAAATAGGRYDGWSDLHLAADYSAAAAAHYSNMTAAAGKGLDFETHYLQSS